MPFLIVIVCNLKAKKAPGFRQKDFALRNAAWAISDTFSNRGAENGTREGFQSWMECEAEIADEKLHIENVQAIDGDINLSDPEFCLGIVKQIRQARDMKLLQHSEIWIGDTGASGFSTSSKQGSKNKRAITCSALGVT